MKYLLCFFITLGCASTKPTPYTRQGKDKFGYQLRSLDRFYSVTYRANRYTPLEQAKTYAEFRGIEVCRKQNKKTNILGIMNKTISKDVLKSSGGGLSYNYWGFYPYRRRYSGFDFGIGFNDLGTDFWTETQTYPIVEVLFKCSKKIRRPLLILKELSSDEMRHLVKDVKGALQLEEVLSRSPNRDKVLVGDIFIRAKGERVEKIYQLMRLFTHDTLVIHMDIFRDGRKVKAPLYSMDVTDDVVKWEDKIIKKVCKLKKERSQEELRKSHLCQE